METGRTIYYQGNTVTAPHPNQKNRERRRIIARSPIDAPDKIMPIEPKVCATSQCVWCKNTQPDGNYNVICDMCHTCQYCGLVNFRNDACVFCGNILPDDLKRSTDKQRVRA